ncbi:hypothetical protein LTS10_007499 [Elasticomyces elasticus]|nr:hypothetical protein LTS10_007499 [Elasticomyces elasticus]
MRLINLSTYELEEHDDYAPPKYAILSHRWENEEVLFAHWKDVKHWRSAEPESRPNGWRKLLSFCDVARDQHGLNYGWADTVAIDKSSSAELTQAINSMYRYYQESSVCIAYLSDVLEDDPSSSGFHGQISIAKVCASKWFTRGWTLQELIAPHTLVFYTSKWMALGILSDSVDMVKAIEGLTNIPTSLLHGIRKKPTDYPIATRMSSASRRVTARPEDEAYCLLGIFDVNLPLIYGEGERAFVRLQEEIVRRSTDHTIFTWNVPRWSQSTTRFAPSPTPTALFAPSPSSFDDAVNGSLTECYRNLSGWVESYEVTNHGLEISLPLIECGSSSNGLYHAILNCRVQGSHGPIALNVKKDAKMYGPRNQHDGHAPVLRPVVVGLWANNSILPTMPPKRGSKSNFAGLGQTLSGRIVKPKAVKPSKQEDDDWKPAVEDHQGEPDDTEYQNKGGSTVTTKKPKRGDKAQNKTTTPTTAAPAFSGRALGMLSAIAAGEADMTKVAVDDQQMLLPTAPAGGLRHGRRRHAYGEGRELGTDEVKSTKGDDLIPEVNDTVDGEDDFEADDDSSGET